MKNLRSFLASSMLALSFVSTAIAGEILTPGSPAPPPPPAQSTAVAGNDLAQGPVEPFTLDALVAGVWLFLSSSRF